jgi:hypothetical protein
VHVARKVARKDLYIQGFGGETYGNRPLGRPRRRWEDILRWIFRKWDVGVWTESGWFRIGAGGGHL